MTTTSMNIKTFNELLASDASDSLISALREVTAIEEKGHVITAANTPQLFWASIPSSPDESRKE